MISTICCMHDKLRRSWFDELERTFSGMSKNLRHRTPFACRIQRACRIEGALCVAGQGLLSVSLSCFFCFFKGAAKSQRPAVMRQETDGSGIAEGNMQWQTYDDEKPTDSKPRNDTGAVEHEASARAQDKPQTKRQTKQDRSPTRRMKIS